MTHEQYKLNVWRAVAQWLVVGRDGSKLDAIAAANNVLSGDVESMIEDCLD